MNFRLICAISLILFIFAPKVNYYSRTSSFPSLRISPLARAYFLGDKSQLRSPQKKVHKSLNLQHLMTPSGLHLSALLYFVGFFTKRSSIFFGILCALITLVFPLAGFSSLKRMIIFGLFKNFPLRKFSLAQCFWLTFSLTFALGMFHQNPLSFTLSFLFLGALLSAQYRLHSFLILFFAQALVSSWLAKDFYPLGSVYGLLLSLTSPLVFLGLITENLFKSILFSKIWMSTISLLDAIKGPVVPNPTLILMPCYFFGSRKELRSISLGLCLVFQTLELNPRFKTKSFLANPPTGYISKKNIKGGVKLVYPNKMRCYSRLKMDEWSTHCY